MEVEGVSEAAQSVRNAQGVLSSFFGFAVVGQVGDSVTT